MNMKQLIMKTAARTATLALALSVLTGCNDRADRQRLLYSDLRSVNKLVLAQMSVSKMATVDDLRLGEARGMKQTAAALMDAVKIGDRKAAYSYRTYMRAYVDLSELDPEDVEVDPNDRVITVRLPEIRTEYAGRDAAITEEHYRVTGMRSNVNAGERALMKERMNTALKQEVEQNPTFRRMLLDKARAKAAMVMESLAGAEGYSVEVEFSE